MKVFINDNPSQKITQAITDFEASVNTEINNLGKTISSLKKNVEDAVQTSANNAIEKIKAGYNDLIANADALLNKLQRDKSFKTQVAGQQIFTSYNSTVSRIDEIIGKIKKITDTKLLSFDIYKKQFLDKLPSNFVNEFLDKKGNELKLLKNILREIDHIEDNLKSKVECAKAEIGYAANVIEDELKNVRTFLEKKYGGFTEEAKKRYEEIKAAYTAEINGRISTMKTDFLIFRNNFRQNVKEVEKRAFDFYHEHACFPQLHTAQVYISAVKDMVNKDVPLKIKYAEDYIKNQVDSRILETQKNASRVFAEIKSDARQHLQSAIRSAAHDLGGIVSPQLGDKYLTFLKDKTNDFKELGQRVGNEFTSQINNEVKYANKVLYEFNKELSNAKQEVLGQYNHLVALTEEVKNSARAGADEIKAKGEEFFKSLEAKIVGSIHLKDLLKGIDFKIPKLERKGNMLTYQFITKEGQIKDVPTPGNQFKFIAEADASKTLLSIYLEKSIKNVGEYRSVTQLKNFTIGVFSERLLVKVDKLELLNTNSVKNKCSFALRKIVFQKELEFFAKLAEGVKIPGTGLILHVTPKEIGVDFTFAIPTIASGAFTLDNLKFVFGVVIPLPVGPAASHQPMVTKIGINGPNDKFTVAVLIFGGKGHFVLETTPRYIRLIDTEIDFGGNLQLSLFIASGKAYLMAGIRYVYERNEEGETTTKLYAILTAGACLTVFGFINISVVFSLYLTYIDSGGHASLYGTCTISCSVSIGFFSKSFDLTMEKRISGTGDPHGSTYVPPRRPSYMLQDDSGIWTEQQSDPDEKYMVKRPDLITHMTNEAWMELLEAYNF